MSLLNRYAEFADCQEIIASNSETVNKLLCMVECHLCFPIQEIVLSETYSKYSTQIAANTLFCCACSLQTPLILAQSSMLHRMITLTSHLLEGNCDLALRLVNIKMHHYFTWCDALPTILQTGLIRVMENLQRHGNFLFCSQNLIEFNPFTPGSATSKLNFEKKSRKLQTGKN